MAEKPASPAPAPAKPAASTTAAEMAQAEKLLAGAEGAKKDTQSAEAKGGHGDKPASSKKKKGKGKGGPSLVARAQHGFRWTRAQFTEIFKGLVSPDRPTRRMSLFFFVSLGVLASVAVLTVRRSSMQKHEREVVAAAAKEDAEERGHEAELLGKSEVPEEHAHVVSMLNMGQFTIELKPVVPAPGEPVAPPKKGGFMNMAEVELVVECDSKETKDFLEENLVQARSQVTDILISIDRDELLSRDGKRKLKKRLIERLNGWMPHGKVHNAFFARLVVA